MKKLLLALYFFSVPLFCKSQCYLQPNGVTTDPRNNFQNAENPVDPIYTNQFFDWTQDYFHNLNWQNTSGPTSANQPHNLPDNSTAFIYNNDDFMPENGWELLRFNKGYINYWEDDEGIGTPNTTNNSVYFILYNKYRSLIRVYFMISPSQADYDYFRVNLKFKDIQMNRTAILSSAEKVIKPLIHFDPLLKLSSTYQFFNSSYLWYFADFTIMYDPCTCDNTLEIEFELETVHEVEIVLNGTSSGQSAPIDILNSSNSVNNFNNIRGTMQSVGNNVQSGQKYFKDVSTFFGNIDDDTSGDPDTKDKMQSGLQHLNNWMGDNNLNFLRYLPYVGEALSLVNIFVGSQSSQLNIPPMGMELSHHFSGTLTDIIPRDLFTLQMPGSANIQQNNRYPLYNEVLGVMNILDRPTVKSCTEITQVFGTDYRDAGRKVTKVTADYKLGVSLSEDDVDIIINPASELQLEEVFAQIQISFFNDIELGWIQNIGDIIRVDKRNFVTPMVPLSCFNEYAFFIDIQKEFSISKKGINFVEVDAILNKTNNQAFMQFLRSNSVVLTAVLKNNNGDRFLHRYTFQSENTEQPSVLDFEGNETFAPGFNMYKNFENDPFWGSSNLNWNMVGLSDHHVYSFEFINQSKVVKESISVESSIAHSQSNGNTTHLVAGKKIIVDENSIIFPGVKLRIGVNEMVCDPIIPTANISMVTEACNSIEYKNKAMPRIEIESNHTDFLNNVVNEVTLRYYPNPATDNIFIASQNAQNNLNVKITILDLQGKRVLDKRINLTPNNTEHLIDVQQLPSGLYIIETTLPDNTLTREKLIIK